MNKAKIIEALTALREQITKQEAAIEVGVDTFDLTSDVEAMLVQAITAILCGEWPDIGHAGSASPTFRNVLMYVSSWVDDPTWEAIGEETMGELRPAEFVDWICEKYDLKIQ